MATYGDPYPWTFNVTMNNTTATTAPNVNALWAAQYHQQAQASYYNSVVNPHFYSPAPTPHILTPCEWLDAEIDAVRELARL